MSISTCYHCHHNHVLSYQKNMPLSFQDSYALSKASLLCKIILSKMKSVQDVVKAEKAMTSFLVVGCTGVISCSIALVAWSVTIAAVAVFAPAIAGSLACLVITLTTGALIGFGLVSSSVIGSFFLLGLWAVAEDIKGKNYKKAHNLDNSLERIRNRSACLILEAKDGGVAFKDISVYEDIEKHYPVAFRQIGHSEDIIRAIEDTQNVAKDIKILVIRGHGNSLSISLEGNNRLGIFTSRPIFSRMNELLNPGTDIVLDSCQTAAPYTDRNCSLAQMISAMCTNRNVWGSTKSFAEKNMKIRSIKPFTMEAWLPSTKNTKLYKVLNLISVYLPLFISKKFTKNCYVVYRNGSLS